MVWYLKFLRNPLNKAFYTGKNGISHNILFFLERALVNITKSIYSDHKREVLNSNLAEVKGGLKIVRQGDKH